MPDDVIPRDKVPEQPGDGRSGLAFRETGRGPRGGPPASAERQSLTPNPRPGRPARALLQALASLTLAIVLLAVYVPVLVWATLAEKWYGTPAVHFAIYDMGWFTAIHVLLAVNILLAMLLRLPWRRRQAGFVLTHGGVLVLLLGCLVTRETGMEATLSVVEGRDSHVAYRSDAYHFEIAVFPGGSLVVPPPPVRVPLITGPFAWKKYAELPWFPWHLPRRSEGVVYEDVGYKDGISLEVLDYVTEPEPSVQVRLAVDDKYKTFNLSMPDPVSYDLGLSERPAPKVVVGHNRRVELALVQDSVDLGFAVHLNEFHRRLDPGSPMPSYYASWVDFLDPADPSRPLQESVVISLNAPADFSDPRTGRSYRLFQEGFDGPWTPEDPKFDKLVGSDRTRDHVYLSQLSVNSDPGRSLKYAGSLLVVLGIAAVYFRKRGQGSEVGRIGNPSYSSGQEPAVGTQAKQPLAVSQIGPLLVTLATVLAGGSAAGAAPLDWNAWEHLPALGRGRVCPLDTFARQTVEAVCGCESPTLAPPEDVRAARLFPDARPRRFGAAELLFSWLVEAEAWEQVAFLPAADQTLRKSFGLPLSDAAGRRLLCVSPHEAGGGDARAAGLLKQFHRLTDARDRFRQLVHATDLPQDELLKLGQRADAMDRMARPIVAAFCGTESPTLSPPKDGSAARLFPDNRPRTFGPGELLLSWLKEPAAWEHVAFLPVTDEITDVLGMAAGESAGTEPRLVSPRQLDRAADRVADLTKKIDALHLARDKFRQLTYNADVSNAMPRRFSTRWDQVKAAWENLTRNPAASKRIGRDGQVRELVIESGQLLEKLRTQLHGAEFSRAGVEPTVVALSRAAEKLRKRLARGDRPTAALGAELGRQAVELELALYDNGTALRLVPALDPAALEENRSPQDDASPWLAFRAMIFGSEDVLRNYPRTELRAVREAFGRLRAAYFNPADDRPAKVAAAMSRFAAAVRTLGEAIDPVRDRLAVLNRDPSLIEATAYPPAAGRGGRPQATTTERSLEAEIFYNRLDAFFWSWIASLAATAALVLAVGKCRRAMFWLGLALLLLAQAITAVGLCLRMYVTGTVPLTGMFETVVFVAFCVALLAVAFTLRPLVGPGLQSAWQMTGYDPRKSDRSANEGRDLGRDLWNVALATLRGTLTLAVFLALARGLGGWHERLLQHFGCQRAGLFDLLPSAAMGSAGPSANDLLAWLIGLCLLGLAVYYLPRAVMTAIVAGPTILGDLRHRGVVGRIANPSYGWAPGVEAALGRRLFALAGAIVSLVAMVLAYYGPPTVMHRSIVAPMAILRDNFWLAVHVATIMGSYASAAIALVLGDMTLGWYLFGRYRSASCQLSVVSGQWPVAGDQRSVSTAGLESDLHPSPPAACRLLAGFAYTAIQITVFLLAAGTILGAVWADNAWGHFWGWDSKEVWARSRCWSTWCCSMSAGRAGPAISGCA